MRQQFVRPDKTLLKGFTLIELVVCVIIILGLVSLLLPATRSARGAARRLQCMNNLKQLSIATINRASSHGGRVPLLMEPAPGLVTSIKVGWVIQLLSYLDHGPAIDSIARCNTESEATSALNTVLANSLLSLQCPEDSVHFRQPGGLSYGANIGYGGWRGTPEGVQADYDFGATDHSAAAIDWNHNGQLDSTDKEIARATGVFWSADSDEFQLTLDDIVNGDGTASTILFAETTDLPPMHHAGIAKNGHNPAALELGIGIGYGALGLARTDQPSLFLNSKQQAPTEYTKFFSPNSHRGTAIGKWPAASSGHSGGVNVGYVDGHTGFVSNEVDWSVWASLHTPNGMRHGEVKISESAF